VVVGGGSSVERSVMVKVSASTAAILRPRPMALVVSRPGASERSLPARKMSASVTYRY
jgi:hypothetical protein